MPAWDNRRLYYLEHRNRLLVSTMRGLLIYDFDTDAWIYPEFTGLGPHLTEGLIVRGIVGFPGSDTLMFHAMHWAIEGMYYVDQPETIWKSTDGGLTWNDATSNAATSQRSQSIAIDPFQVGRALFGETNKMYASNDFGGSWHEITDGVTLRDWPGPSPWEIAFSTSIPGLVLYGGTGEGIFRSTDHGESWTHVWADEPFGPDQASIQPIQIVQDNINPARWYAIVTNRMPQYYDFPGGIYTSADTGKTWSLDYKFDWYGYVQRLQADPSVEGRLWIAGIGGLLRVDLNGVAPVIEQLAVPSARQTFEDVIVSDDGTIFLSQMDGPVRMLKDGVWSTLPTPLAPLYWDSGSWTVGNRLFYQLSGGMYERTMSDPTSDFQRWDGSLDILDHYSHVINDKHPAQRAIFQGQYEGILDSVHARVFVTPDGGSSWEQWGGGDHVFPDNLYWGHFVAEDTLLALGIYYGSAYLVYPDGYTRLPDLVAGVGSYTGAGQNGVLQGWDDGVYVTKNAGRSWTKKFGGSGYLIDGKFGQALFAIGVEDIYYSVDDGETWTQYQNTPGYNFWPGGVSYGRFYYVDFDGRKVYGGFVEDDSWVDLTGNLSPTYQTSEVSVCTDYLLVTGRDEQGELQTFITSDMLGVDSPHWEALPSNFILDRPYPNPFNASVSMNMQLPHDAEIQVTVHNLLGREVARLVDGHVSQGTHSLIWDAKDFASGSYYIKLTSPGETSVSRVITLVK